MARGGKGGAVMPARGPERPRTGSGPHGDPPVYKSGAWSLEPPRVVKDERIGAPVVPAGGGGPDSKGSIVYPKPPGSYP